MIIAGVLVLRILVTCLVSLSLKRKNIAKLFSALLNQIRRGFAPAGGAVKVAVKADQSEVVLFGNGVLVSVIKVQVILPGNIADFVKLSGASFFMFK